MDQVISCPACQARMKVRPEHAGRKVRCPKCQEILSVPEVEREVDFVAGPPPESPRLREREDFEERAPRRQPRWQEDVEDDPDLPPPRKRLGSLAQAARGKKLTGARVLFSLIGVLSLGFGLYLFLDAQGRVDREVKRLGLGGRVDPVAVERAVRINRIGGAIDAALGVIYIVLAIVIYRFAVAATVTGLVIYLGTTVLIAVLQAQNQGHVAPVLFIRVLVILGLVASVPAAIAYQRAAADERRRDDLEEDYEPS